jgi:hypothetical protein
MATIDTCNTAWAARLVEAFDGSGVHRMCTPGDFASGAWFEAEAVKTGSAVKRMRVATQRTVVEEAYVECAGLRVDGLPMFDAPSSAGLSGTLGIAGSASDIGLAEFASNAASIKGQALEKLRRTCAHKALIVATKVTGDSLAPINAQFFDTLIGPPVLQVPGGYFKALSELAAEHAPVTFVSRYRREPMDSYNIEARATSGTNAAPLAVVTPRTGWWESTAERAGGMVAWLAALEAAAHLKRAGQLKRDVAAWATCGHELGHIGLNEMARFNMPMVTGAHYWLHLGANLGGAGNLTMMVRATVKADAEAMRDLLVAENYPCEHILVEPDSKLSGEGHDLHHLGAKVLSLAGSNLHFHAASDRWPGNVNVAGIASISRAVAHWVAKQAG